MVIRYSRYLLTLAFIGLAIIALSAISHEATAEPHYWKGTAGAPAGTPSNWQPAITNWATSDLYWGAVADTNCAYNLSTSVNSWNILGNYTQTVTQGTIDVKVGAGGIAQAGGVFTTPGGSLKSLTVAGSITKTGGTWTNDNTNLVVNKDGSTLNINTRFGTFRCSGNISTYSMSPRTITVDAGKTLTIISGNTLTFYISGTVTNSGTINGLGTFTFNCYDRDFLNYNFGTINCPLIITTLSASASRIVSLSGNTVFGSTVTVSSSHASYTMTLNLNGKTMSCTALTVSTRGIVSAGAAGSTLTASSLTVSANGALNATNISVINCNGNWDTSVGIYSKGSAAVNIPDTNKTIKIASGQTFYKLNILASANNPKWIINNAGTQAIFWNVTGLTAGRDYNFFVSYSQNSKVTPDGSGILAESWNSWSIKQFELRMIPVITALPISSPDYTRHQIAEMMTYDAGYSADQTVTWGLTANATFLSLSGTNITGTPAYASVGVYSVSLRAYNTNGQTFYNYTLTVTNVVPNVTSTPVLTIPLYDLYVYDVNANEEGTGMSYTMETTSPDLVIDQNTGIITGHISVPGTFDVNITVDDHHGGVVHQDFALVIEAPAMITGSLTGIIIAVMVIGMLSFLLIVTKANLKR